MARILAIDFGLKRTGIAVTDPLQLIATPLQAVESGGLMNFLAQYLSKETVETIVIGDPLNLDGSSSGMSKHVITLRKKVESQFPHIKVVLVDERFTSHMAKRSILSSGVKKKDRRDKSLTDIVSAAILLQHYLDSRR